MNITILNVTIETKPTAKGSYQVADVAYKNNSFQGKVEGKKVMSFGTTAEAFKVLASAQPGQTYNVSVVKNEKGYNDWTAMQQAVPEPMGTSSLPPSAAGAKAQPSTFGRDFETREERAKKQVYIVRQSTVSSAIAALSVGGKAALKADEVIGFAKKLEEFVFDTGTGFDDVPTLDPSFHQEPQI